MKKAVFIIVIVVVVVAGIGIWQANQTEASACLKSYFECLSNGDYEGMYNYVSTDTSKEDFVTRVKNIYEGIEATNISITILTNETSEEDSSITSVSFNNSMSTIAGSVNFMNTVDIKETDGEYKIIWDSSVIFSDLKDDYKVRVSTLESTRGTIYDRNGNAIAEDGEVYSVGLVPGSMNSTTDLGQLANLLGISEDTINTALNASYVQDDTFVPLRKISKDEQELKNELLKIKGVLITDVTSRVYPYNEATSILTGYVQDEEGKSGLEYAYNDRLKGTDGAEIYIMDSDGNKVKTLVKTDAVNGEDITTTIDVELQVKIYEQFEDDEAAVVAMDYNTGEVFALVSMPSYDANDFALGITTEEWEELQNDESQPMYNRYLATYAPGSSMKPMVGAIGLTYGSFTADEDFGTSGTKWQNSSSWGDLYVTTLETYSGTANLRNALIYSDNIYFAKAALKIGKTNLQAGLNSFGFNEKISFVQDVTTSTYGEMNSEAALANSGYGQDELLVNPIHMAMMYSTFANGGNIVMPCLEYTETKYYKQSAISSEIANIIKEDLVQVVEQGTAQAAKIEGKTLAGKTGTAEVKSSQDDEDGTEIGWFNVFDEEGLLIVSMVEDVQDLGGSHYLLPKIKSVLEN